MLRRSRQFALAALVLPLALSCVSTAAASVSADDFHLIRFGAREGLPGGTITALLQRRSKHLIIAVTNRLLSFDGVRARPLPSPDFSLDTEIISLVEDPTGALWVGTLRGPGLVRIDGSRVRTFAQGDGLPDQDITALCVSSAGELWAGTDAGLARFDGQRFHRVAVDGVAPGHRVRAVGCAADGDVWVSFSDGPLRRLRQGRALPFAHEEEIARRPVRRIYFARDGAIWLGGMAGGLFRWHGGKLSEVAPQGLPGGRVKALHQDGQGRMWVGTWGGGVALLMPGADGQFSVTSGFDVDVVSEILEDHEGTIWIASTTGLLQLRGKAFFPIGTGDGLTSGLVRAVLEAPDGSIWVGSSSGGLNRLQQGRVVGSLGTAQGLPGVNVTALALDSDGALLVGTDQGACRLQGDQCRPIPALVSLGRQEIRAMHLDRERALWLATRSGQLVRLHGDRVTRHEGKGGLTVGFTVGFARDARDDLWIGSEGGLYRWEADRFVLRHRLPGRHSRVYSLTARKDGGLWVASAIGLALVEPNGLRIWGPGEGVPGPVMSAVEDGRGFLWMGSRDGLLRAALPDGLPARRLSLRTFAVEEGLKSADFGHPASPAGLRAQDGTLWFTAAEELVRVAPERVQVVASDTPVSIEAITADGHPLALRAPVTIPPGTERLEIEFTALSFRAPTRNRFRFKLENFDPDWVEASTGRSAAYTRLPPGDYTFQVVAADLGGGWAGRGASLRVIRPPRLHERTLVQLAALLLGFAGTSALVYTVRVRRVRMRFAAITEERNRIARELHDTLEQGLTSVALHIKAAEKRLGDTEGARSHLQASHAVLEHVQDDLRHDLWDLRGRGETHADLGSALDEAARDVRSSAGLRVAVRHTGGPLALPPKVETALLRIAQAAMANVVRHAAATQIDLELDLSDPRRVRLQVRDDGRGFDVPARPRWWESRLGLAGMCQRAERLGGQVTFESARGQGTVVRVEVPLRRPS